MSFKETDFELEDKNLNDSLARSAIGMDTTDLVLEENKEVREKNDLLINCLGVELRKVRKEIRQLKLEIRKEKNAVGMKAVRFIGRSILYLIFWVFVGSILALIDSFLR